MQEKPFYDMTGCDPATQSDCTLEMQDALNRMEMLLEEILAVQIQNTIFLKGQKIR